MDPPRRVLTCDPGIDDAIAIVVLGGRVDAGIDAVVAGAGNVDAPTAWRNAAGVATLAGLDVPVAMGSADAVGGTPIHRAGHAHGIDGLAGLADRLPTPGPGRAAPSTEPGTPAEPTASGQPAAGRQLVRGDVLATGPLTDVALALRAGQPVGRVVWLGGSLTGLGILPPSLRGPQPPAVEFNASADPLAVSEVLASVPEVWLVPVEVSGRVALTAADLDRWAGGAPAARFCAELGAARRGSAGVVLHDPVAVVAALEPALFRWEPLALECTDGGGLVLDDRRSPTTHAAIDVDARAVHDRIVEAVLSCPG